MNKFEKISKIREILLLELNELNSYKINLQERINWLEKLRTGYNNLKAEISGSAELKRDENTKAAIKDLQTLVTLVDEFANDYNAFFKKFGGTTPTGNNDAEKAVIAIRERVVGLSEILLDVIGDISKKSK